jgi:hypothetical protein
VTILVTENLGISNTYCTVSIDLAYCASKLSPKNLINGNGDAECRFLTEIRLDLEFTLDMLENKEFPRLVQSTKEEVEQSVLSPKAVDELREILRKDEDVREFFILLKNRDLRSQAIEKLNTHLGHRTLH